jgi:microcystin-dependent protein
MTTQFTCTGADGTFITYSTADANGRYNVPFTLIPNTAANLNVYLWDATDQEYDLIQQDDADNPWIYDPANNRIDFDGAGPAVGTATLPDGSTQGTLMLARVTDVSEDELAQFTPGSSIRSQDLNDNFNKLGNAIEELHCNATLNGEDFESFYWNKVDVDAGGDTYTSTSTSAWPSNNTTIATTAAGDERWLNATGGNVIGGDGIDVTEAGGSVTIAVDLDTNSGLEFDSGELRIDVGDGLVTDANGLAVDLANPSGLEFTNSDLRIDANDGCEIVADGLNAETTAASVVQTGGTNDNPAVRIATTLGTTTTNTDLVITGGANTTVTRDSNNQLTIATAGGTGLTYRGTVDVTDDATLPTDSNVNDLFANDTEGTQTANWQTVITGASTTANQGDLLLCTTAAGGTATDARYTLIESGTPNSDDQTLQEVTTNGNTTTNAIILDDTSLQIQEGADTLTVNWPTGTADRTISFPDASGTIALTGGDEGATVSVGENPPEAAADDNQGDLWWNSNTGRLFVSFANGADDPVWTEASPATAGNNQNLQQVLDTGNESNTDLQLSDGAALILENDDEDQRITINADDCEADYTVTLPPTAPTANGQVLSVASGTTDAELQWSTPATGDAIPAGTVVNFAGATAPDDWLFCDGSAISRTTNAALFTAIGTTYGTGDGSTTFNIPDTRGFFVRGLNTTSSGEDPSRTLGTTQDDATAVNNLSLSDPGHSHNINNAGTNGVAGGSGSWIGGSATPTTTTSESTGITFSSSDTETRPVNIAFNYIIKT